MAVSNPMDRLDAIASAPFRMIWRTFRLTRFFATGYRITAYFIIGLLIGLPLMWHLAPSEAPEGFHLINWDLNHEIGYRGLFSALFGSAVYFMARPYLTWLDWKAFDKLISFVLGLIGIYCFFTIAIGVAVGSNYGAVLLDIALRGVLPLFVIGLLPALSKFFVRLGEAEIIRRLFRHGKGGSARWAGLDSFEAMDIESELAKVISPGEKDDGMMRPIYLGRTLRQDDPHPRIVGFDDDGHLLTIAQTGAGKSFSAQWPILKTYSGPAIIFDPSAEHVIHTSSKRKRNGPWAAFDPFGEVAKQRPDLAGQVEGYNLLSEIDLEDPNARAYIRAIADGCVLGDGSKEGHFTENSKIILGGFIAHVLNTATPENRNLPYVYDLLLGYDSKLGLVDPERINDTITDMRGDHSAGRLPMQAATILEEAGDRERGSFFTTIVRSLEWTTDESMRAHLAPPAPPSSEEYHRQLRIDMDAGMDEHDGREAWVEDKDVWPSDLMQAQIDAKPYRIKDLAKNGNRRTLYIVLPDNHLEEQKRWFRCLTNLTIAYIRNLPKAPDPAILFVLEELPTLERLEVIEKGIQTLRKRGVKLWCVVQHIGQLQELYKANWQTFVSASTVQVFGVNDPNTAKWVSERIGTFINARVNTEQTNAGPVSDGSIQEDKRNLMTPDELDKWLRKDVARQIVFPMTKTSLPMRLERLAADYNVPKFKKFPVS